ncbi:hypothetical protein PMI05_03141 [Brevibacillus sp. BC25]|nr:hypothetical protein PMI05_03141 [Brevibacillus sp. BC25]
MGRVDDSEAGRPMLRSGLPNAQLVYIINLWLTLYKETFIEFAGPQ